MPRLEDYGTDHYREYGPIETPWVCEDCDGNAHECVCREWRDSSPDDPRGCVVLTDDGREIGITLAEDMHDAGNPWGVSWGGWLSDERTFGAVNGVVLDDATGERIGVLKQKGWK